MDSQVMWFEIPVVDMERARAFYGEVLGVELPLIQSSVMLMAFFPASGSANGGALIQHPNVQPSNQGTLIYLNAGEDMTGALERAERAGGKVLARKTMILPEYGYFALILDTEGNKIGLHSNR